MPAVNDVGEPCAGEPHARFEVAGAGNGTQQCHRASPRPYAGRVGAVPAWLLVDLDLRFLVVGRGGGPTAVSVGAGSTDRWGFLGWLVGLGSDV
jgi:hypothetical protein